MTFDLQEAAWQLAQINPGQTKAREFRVFLETYLRSWCPDVKVKILREKIDLQHFVRPKSSICYVSGMYDADEDQEGFPCITIYVTISDDVKEMVLDVIHWHFFTISVIETLLHEKVHQRQARDRGFKPLKKQPHYRDQRKEYLANDDEVEAFACSAAVILLTRAAEIDHITEEYKRLFGLNSKVFTKFIKHRTKYLNSLGDAHA